MQRPGNARELPTTNIGAPVYKSSSAAVYRSLELPLSPPANLDFHHKTAGKSHPSLVGPTATKQGEAFFTLKESPKSILVVEKEHKPLPIPLIVANAPQNSFVVQSDPVSAVVDEIHKLFARHSVDVVYNPAKFKWKCACYSSYTETRFVAKMFSVPEKSNYFVLDFQRRCGDAFHFQSIHRALNNELLKSGFVINCSDGIQATAPLPVRTFKPMALPADFFEKEEAPVDDVKEYEALCQMCRSPYIDVQREGLRTLASQLEQKPTIRASLKPFASELLALMSKSRDAQVRRLAVSSLAWIASTSTLSLVKDEIQTVSGILLNETELSETRRQAGTVLSNLERGSWPKDLAASVKSTNIIARNDPRLAEIVQKLQQVL